MAVPTIVINNSTGSDTAASGAGPGTALTGSLAATHANTTVNITDAVALGGVPTDGSAVFWVKSSSGRQFSAITAISGTSGAWVITVGSAFANTESGKTWAIGGKRATLDHADTRQLGGNIPPGWTIDIQRTGVDYTLTSVFILNVTVGTVTADKPVTITSSSATRPVITTSTNSINMFDLSNSDPIIIKNIAFSNTAGTKGSYAAGTGMCFTMPAAVCYGLSVVNCIFDGFVSAIMADNVVNYQFIKGLTVIGTEIKNCTDRGIGFTGTQPLHVDHCWIHNNVGDGINTIGNNSSLIVIDSTFSGNGGRGFYAAAGSNSVPFTFIGNNFKGNTFSGIEHGGTQFSFVCHDNIFVSNGAYGIRLSIAEATINSQCIVPLIFRNAFYNNTSGTVLNCPPDTGDNVILTGDPFISSTDFGLNATAGAGAAVKNMAPNAPNVSANAAGDMGAIPSSGATAGPVYFAR